MKTPDEIKTGVEFCTTKVVSGNLKTCDLDCPYHVEGVWCRNALAHDTLAYIEQLEAKAPRWISVKKKLPEKQLRVIVCNGHGLVTAGWRSYNKDAKGNELWVVGSEPHHANDILYWMPLPEPPEV